MGRGVRVLVSNSRRLRIGNREGAEFSQKNVPKYFMITAHCLVMGFFAGLGRQSKGNGITLGFSQDNFALDDGVGAVDKTGNVEAFLGLDIFADNLINFDDLGDTGLDGLGIGQVNSDGFGGIDSGDFVSLGLVFLTAVLVFSSTVVITITGGFAGSDLHGFGFLNIVNLGDTGIQSVGLVLVRVGAKYVG